MRRKPMLKKEYVELEKQGELIPGEDYSLIINEVQNLAIKDTEQLHVSEQSYGDSWRKRGGVGAFMMLARKWDRLEKQVEEHGYDIFKAIKTDTRPEGIIDDIRDLRRYLLLVDAHIQTKGANE